MYFAVAGMVRRFDYLDVGLAIVLILIGLKMIAEGFLDIPFDHGRHHRRRRPVSLAKERRRSLDSAAKA